MNYKKELAKNTLFLSLGTALTKILQFIMVPFFTAWLSVDDFGNFDLLCTYVTLLIPIITLSTTQGIFRFLVDERSVRKQKNIVASSLLLYVISIAIITLIFTGIYIATGWSMAIPFVILFISQTINDYFQGFARGIKKLNIYSLCMAITTIFIAVFSTIFIKILNLGLSGIVYGYSVGYIIGNVFLVILTKFWHYFSIRYVSWSTLSKIIKYSYVLTFNDISWWIVNVSDRSIITFFINSAANGVYAIASKIPSLCSSIFNMFSISWQQTASEKVNSEDRNVFINEVYNSSLSILISLCIGILSCNFILFNYVFDSNYYAAQFHVPILILAIIFNSISQFLGGIQISLKRPKANSISTIFAAIVNIVIDLIFINIIGLYAASISTLIANTFIVVYRQFQLRHVIKLKLNRSILVYSGILLYFFIAQYIFYKNLAVSVINLFIAGIIFIIINRQTILKMLQKINQKRKA